MFHDVIFISLTCLFGFMMTWSVGANDLSNVLSTAMGSKTLTVKNAIILAIIFEFGGAFLASGQVTDTIRHGIINMDVLANTPDLMIYGMLAAMSSATCWMTLASYLGMPVSITHTIVGSIVGFGWVVIGFNAVHWKLVALIGSSWILSPALSCLLSYLLFMSIQRLILGTEQPFIMAKRYARYYLFLIGFILSVITVLKGLNHFGFTFTVSESLLIAVFAGCIVSLWGSAFIRNIEFHPQQSRHSQFKQTEKIFAILMLFTACAMVFAHGSNDVANAVGPMTIIICIIKAGNKIMAVSNEAPLWILSFGCLGILIGFLMYGRKVIANVGSGITALTPSRAFAATLAAACTTILATSTGIPSSATQILVGGILGVGIARGIGALNLTMIRNIFMSWIITLPIGAGLTIVFFYLFKAIFNG